MSTPLVVLASILALFAVVLIPFMMVKSGQQNQVQHHAQGKPRKKKKKK